MSDDLGEPRLLIDGRLVMAEGGQVHPNVNPATEEVIGDVADASAADVDRAIAAARRAFDTTRWATDRAARRRCLEQLQAALEKDREALRRELIAEVGAPLLATYGPQLDMPLGDAVTHPAQAMADFPWERELPMVDSPLGRARRLVVKEPVGVVGAIVPWNFPLEITLHKVAQALATGNTVVIKPAPDTPWSATHLGRLVAEQTDIPPGVVNVVASSSHERGQVAIANDSIYGLSGSVSSASDERALAVARRIRTGTLSVNGGNWYAADSPFGGDKASGIGRQGGAEGFEQYLETKTIALPARRG